MELDNEILTYNMIGVGTSDESRLTSSRQDRVNISVTTIAPMNCST